MSLDRPESTENPTYYYVPSGRVDLLRFLPLVAAGLLVSAVMAFVLVVAESWFYLYMITPLVLGLPTFGMAWVAVNWGRCRNRGLAGFVGVLLAFVYYVGFWELSYLANIVSQGPAAVAVVEQVGGAPGLPGYFLFRCKTSRPKKVGQADPKVNRPPGTIDLVFNVLLFGGEAVLTACAGVAIARSAASRPYSEGLRRWASPHRYNLPIVAVDAALSAVEHGDWEAMAALPRTGAIGEGQTPNVLFRIDHFPGELSEPAYVSLSANVGPLKKRPINRREIPPDQMDALGRAYPELKLSRQDEPASRPQSHLDESLARMDLLDARPEPIPSTPAQGDKPGDFRTSAAEASRAFLAGTPALNLATVASSLCLPASEDGRRQMRNLSWISTLSTAAPSVGMFGFLLGCLGVSSLLKADAGLAKWSDAVAAAGLAGAFACVVAGFYIWTRGLRIWRTYVANRIVGRPGSPLGSTAEPPSLTLALEDGRTFNKPKLLGDDCGLVYFDGEHRRIMAEGLIYRYVIRAEDIVNYWPIEALSSVGARVDVRVGEVVLPLVFTSPDVWSQIPLGGWSSRRVRREFFGRFREALGDEVVDQDPAKFANKLRNARNPFGEAEA